MKKLGFYFTDEELANHTNGFIGERQGIKCYLSEPIEVAKEKLDENIKKYNEEK